MGIVHVSQSGPDQRDETLLFLPENRLVAETAGHLVKSFQTGFNIYVVTDDLPGSKDVLSYAEDLLNDLKQRKLRISNVTKLLLYEFTSFIILHLNVYSEEDNRSAW